MGAKLKVLYTAKYAFEAIKTRALKELEGSTNL